MSDLLTVVLAIVTGAGALFPTDSSLIAPAVVFGVTGFLTKAPMLVCVASGLLSSALSAAAWDGLGARLSEQVDGTATIVHDPHLVAHASVAEVRIGGRHYQLFTRGATARVLDAVSAGERVRVAGHVRPLRGIATSSERRRHVTANVDASTITVVGSGNLLSRTANGLRTLIGRGDGSLSLDDRSLLTGFVYGDDRNESSQLKVDFQQSGLAHLLAVSGENVAFVLILIAPVLRSFSLTGRFLGGLAALVVFGAVTRWEPSVVRAEMMAGIALIASYMGRPMSLVRCLALGITASLLLDPFLIGSVGFLMSVMACCGMALLGSSISRAIPGPRWLARSAGYSAAAQIGVAPVQLAVFGTLPVLGVITNVLAEPAAGLIMMWGVVGGLIGGLVGEPFASIVHLPTHFLIDWICSVAHWGARFGQNGALAWGLALLLPVALLKRLSQNAGSRGPSGLISKSRADESGNSEHGEDIAVNL